MVDVAAGPPLADHLVADGFQFEGAEGGGGRVGVKLPQRAEGIAEVAQLPAVLAEILLREFPEADDQLADGEVGVLAGPPPAVADPFGDGAVVGVAVAFVPCGPSRMSRPLNETIA